MQDWHEKDWLDVVLDFFYGAAFCDFWVGVCFFREMRSSLDSNIHWHVLFILLLTSTAIGGALAALFREQFWSGYEKASIIPPIQEKLSIRKRNILWVIFSLGCLMPLSFFWIK